MIYATWEAKQRQAKQRVLILNGLHVMSRDFLGKVVICRWSRNLQNWCNDTNSIIASCNSSLTASLFCFSGQSKAASGKETKDEKNKYIAIGIGVVAGVVVIVVIAYLIVRRRSSRPYREVSGYQQVVDS